MVSQNSQSPCCLRSDVEFAKLLGVFILFFCTFVEMQLLIKHCRKLKEAAKVGEAMTALMNVLHGGKNADRV